MFHDFEVFTVAETRHYAEVFDPTTGQVRDYTQCYASAADAERAGKDVCAAMDAQRAAHLRALARLHPERRSR